MAETVALWDLIEIDQKLQAMTEYAERPPDEEVRGSGEHLFHVKEHNERPFHEKDDQYGFDKL